MEDEELRQLWAITIPGANLDDQDPGLSYRPPELEQQRSGETPVPELPSLLISQPVISGDIPLDDVEDSQAPATLLSDPASLPTLQGIGSGLPEGEQPSGDPFVRQPGAVINLDDTQDPLSAATIHEPPPESALVQSEPFSEAPQVGEDGPASPAGPSTYELIEVIGEGGMGVVYRARQRALRREVAIKTTQKARSGRRWRDRFVTEAVVTGRLDHPNIVPVYDLGDAQGQAMLAMKLVEGVSWKRLLHPKTEAEQARAADVDQIDHLRILIAVANAVAFAHTKGVVHNDLKPENVMVGEFGEVLVMDWGLAVEVGTPSGGESSVQPATSIKSPCGTPSYMAPELAEGRGQDIGPWTDVYLLGAILHEIVTGKPPHTGGTFAEIVMKAIRSKPLSYSEDVPAELQAICLKAMARSPEDRYQEVIELREAVEEYLDHRESRQVAARAEELLEGCRRLSAQSLDETGRNTLYADFAGAVAGFAQARLLWVDNPEAQAGERAARLEFARTAAQHGDLGLAAAQLAELDDDAESLELKHEVAERRAQRAEEEQRAAQAKRNLRLALGVILGGLVLGFAGMALGFFVVRAERDEAQRQERLAKEARDAESEARAEAQQASTRAENARRAAEQQLAESLVATGDLLARNGRSSEARDNFARAAQLLRGLGQSTLPADLGAWVLGRQSEAPLVTLEGHAAAVTALAFLPTLADGGGVLISGDASGELRIWDPLLGDEIARREGVHQGRVRHLVINRDGTRLASGGDDGKLTVWALDQGRLGEAPLFELLAHEGPVVGLGFSKGGRALFSGAAGELELWDARQPSEEPLASYADERAGSGELIGLAASPNGSFGWSILSGGEVGEWFLGPPGNLRGRGPIAALPAGLAQGMAVSSKSAALAIPASDHSLRLVSQFKWVERRTRFNRGERTEEDVDFTIWGAVEVPGHRAPIDAVAWTPNGEVLLSGSRDGQLLAWSYPQTELEVVRADGDERKPTRRPDLIRQASAPSGITALATGPRATLVAAGAADGRIRLYDLGLAEGLTTGAEVDRWARVLPFPEVNERDGETAWSGTAAALNPDLAAVATWREGFQLRRAAPQPAQAEITLWDRRAGRPLKSFGGHERPVRLLAFTPEGELISVDETGVTRLWSVGNRLDLPVASLERQDEAAPLAMAVDPQARRLALAEADGVRIFALGDGQELRRLDLPGAQVLDLAGDTLLAGGPEGGLWLGNWRQASRPTWTHPGLGAITAASAELQIVGLATGQLAKHLGDGEWSRPLPGHAAAISRLLPLEDRRFVSASRDGSWRIWESLASRETLKELRAFDLAALRGSPEAELASTGGALRVAASQDGSGLGSVLTTDRLGSLVWELSRPGQLKVQRDRVLAEGSELERLVSLAAYLAARGALRQALQLYSRAQGIDPEAVDPLQLLRCHWELGHVQLALEELGRLEPGDPRLPPALRDALRDRLASSAQKAPSVLGRARDIVRALDVDAGGRRIASASRAGWVGVWDAATERLVWERPVSFEEHADRRDSGLGSAFYTTETTSLRFDAEGHLVVGGKDGFVRRFDGQSGAQLGPSLAAHRGYAAVRPLPDGRLLTKGDNRAHEKGNNLLFTVWSAPDAAGARERVWDLEGFRRIRGWTVAPELEGGRLAVSTGEEVQVWALAPDQSEPLLAFEVPDVGGLAFTQEGNLLCVDKDEVIRLRSLATGEVRGELKGHEGRSSVYAFRVRGTLAISADSSGQAIAWDLARGVELGRWQAEEILLEAAVGSEGRFVLGGRAGALLTGRAPNRE